MTGHFEGGFAGGAMPPPQSRVTVVAIARSTLEGNGHDAVACHLCCNFVGFAA
jgi:hypothetical protein